MIYIKMLNLEKTYEDFCKALPSGSNISEENKKNLFDLMLAIVYNYYNFNPADFTN